MSKETCAIPGCERDATHLATWMSGGGATAEYYCLKHAPTVGEQSGDGSRCVTSYELPTACSLVLEAFCEMRAGLGRPNGLRRFERCWEMYVDIMDEFTKEALRDDRNKALVLRNARYIPPAVLQALQS